MIVVRGGGNGSRGCRSQFARLVTDGGVEGDVIKKEAKPAVRNAGVMQVRYRSKLGCLRFS